MKIQVLGTGCSKCTQLYANVQKAVAELQLDAEVEKVQDIDAILAMGVVLTPGLMVDGKLRASGRVPNVEEVKKILS
ncbi:MAG: TM0996/MTH895 family glutaredoxin-like protein [Thermoguttaceae bacterium]|nr:TM0996/MTH895 family glutaredoxin-like protein [Thermoguttaceae bacterium]